ncbi:uncharacterized protein SCHCODRAFT_02645858 [Schizophyllum commune H4-8]|uniref:uncharacterized protein n=1 Tax=Schizophyllum commune (strain H4-8 / FGSC 9210) TaxID=578458 RepID=UPI00215E5EEE|nr:uncharacterized protein SCHCODRAFT_02645858 [Schizophyllum commune H4-8]KAI5884948.1 hypothetical protein SCHCODRAFT_02645858 [Schizophyllum commune H4-8]
MSYAVTESYTEGGSHVNRSMSGRVVRGVVPFMVSRLCPLASPPPLHPPLLPTSSTSPSLPSLPSHPFLPA